jgi:nucleoside-diphosphate-sugar epimerase
LVTGAHGCIGAWTLRQLVREEVETIGVDIGVDDHRVRAILSPTERGRLRFLRADISDPAQIAALFAERPTLVVHLAALQIPACRENPVLGAQVNVVGTVALFAAALAAGLQTPLVYASSAAAFAAGDGDGDPPRDPSGPPDTHYGVFKTANEGSARIFAASGLSSIGLRPYVVYGPGRDQGLTSAPTKAMNAAAHGESFMIPYSGLSEMQYAPDVAAAFVAAARSSFTGAATANLPGSCVSTKEIVREIERVVPQIAGRIGSDGPPLPFPEKLDSTNFASVVGDIPRTPFAEGVEQTIAHFRAELR